MTTAKMYKWNGSARRIWGLKCLLLWELFFDFMIELGQKLQGENWFLSQRRRSQRATGFLESEILRLKIQKLKLFGKKI